MININFNNCGQESEGDPYFKDESHKKLFFDFLYESLKLNKTFEKIASIVDKEEVYRNIVNKKIPFFKFAKYVTTYLRKSEPNILNKVKLMILI